MYKSYLDRFFKKMNCIQLRMIFEVTVVRITVNDLSNSSLSVTLIHASLRMRGLKNKLTNKLETAGLRRTPMGIILDGLGQEAEIVVQG